MHVQMIDRLTSFFSIVYDDAESICYAFLLSHYFCSVKKLTQNFSMPWFSLVKSS